MKLRYVIAPLIIVLIVVFLVWAVTREEKVLFPDYTDEIPEVKPLKVDIEIPPDGKG